MPITKINSYDSDEVFKQKCNENFSDINARVVSRTSSLAGSAPGSIGFGSFNDVYPIGSVICTTKWAEDKDSRLQIGTWRYLGSSIFEANNSNVSHPVQFYERIA